MLQGCDSWGQRDNASVGSNAWLSVLCRHTNKFAALAGIGCSSVGVANLEITAGGFQHYLVLGMNFKTLWHWVGSIVFHGKEPLIPSSLCLKVALQH